MPTRYLILRANMPAARSFGFASPASWSPSTPGPTDLAIETTHGQESDVGDLRSDPQNMAVMDAEVVFQLIAPKSQASANTAGLVQVGALKMPAGLLAIGAHTAPFTGRGVTVAVLDTGIDETHPAFHGKMIVKKDFTGEGADEQDVTDHIGHGTHCAATICGAPVGDTRVGVAPGILRLCVGKVLGREGGTLEMLLKGLCWAVLEQKASVVSMSLGYDLAGNAKRLIAKGKDPAAATQEALQQQSEIIKGISTLRAFLESQSPMLCLSRRPETRVIVRGSCRTPACPPQSSFP